jgi:hypothetical protein
MTRLGDFRRKTAASLAVMLALVLIVGGVSLACLMDGGTVRHLVKHADDALCEILPSVSDVQAASMAADLPAAGLATGLALIGLPALALPSRSSTRHTVAAPAPGDPLFGRLLL